MSSCEKAIIVSFSIVDWFEFEIGWLGVFICEDLFNYSTLKAYDIFLAKAKDLRFVSLSEPQRYSSHIQIRIIGRLQSRLN